MEYGMRIVSFSIMLLLSAAVGAQSLPQGISPQMIQQVQSLSPAQQQALARQYGITLPSQGAPIDDVPQLATPGSPVATEARSKPIAPKASTEEVKTQARIRFGRNLFNQEVSTFAPTDDAPVPDYYRLGVGDQLIVSLFGKENEQLSLQIGRDGTVALPRLGVIALGGLTFEDARDLIKTRIQQQLIGVEAVVSMGRLRAIGIFMAGEVRVPGTYSVSALTTVTQALFQAGGVTDIGSLRNIQVKRGGELVTQFDAYDLLMRGDATGDVRLQSGDVIFVPPYAGVAEVQGEVKRPMVYELVGSETVADLVAMAGAYTQQAYPSLAVLTRKPADGSLAAAISLNLNDAETQSLPLVNGDILRVPKSGAALANSVTLKGAVNRPGIYGWFEGMRVSHLLSDVRTDLLREADLSYALIVSYENELLDIVVKQFSLVDAIAHPGTLKDPLLQEFDDVLVFSLPELEGVETSSVNGRKRLLAPVIAKLQAQAREDEPVKTVSISGAVRAPGTYPLTTATTISALIAAAGGLKDSAYLEAAEYRQLDERRGGEVVVSYEEVDLAKALTGKADLPLASRDHLTVRNIPDWSPSDSVTLAGEVTFPGTYLIQRGETLADVIARAGGLTQDAFPEAAVLTRVEIAKREAERARAFARDIQQTYASRLLTEETTTSSLAEVIQVSNALEGFEGRGRMLIDLPLALTGDASADVEVTDGDTLLIPKRVNTVTVVGEVFQPGTHTFSPGSGVAEYLSLSAGFTPRADNDGVYVIKANGLVATMDQSWWRFGGAVQQLAPGDTIVVPVNTNYKESFAVTREVTQILYQSIVSVAAVASLL